MKKKIIILSIVVVSGILGFIVFHKFFNNDEEKYLVIKENIAKAVEKEIKAVYPNCMLSKGVKETHTSHHNSTYLVNQGYLKKSDLLDVDGKSYCDTYVVIYSYFQNPLDQQKNCEVSYKIYLKCQNYEEKGYKK